MRVNSQVRFLLLYLFQTSNCMPACCIAPILILVVGTIRKKACAPDISHMRGFAVSIHAVCISCVGMACAPAAVVRLSNKM